MKPIASNDLPDTLDRVHKIWAAETHDVVQNGEFGGNAPFVLIEQQH